MSDTPNPTLTLSPRRWNWFPVCCLSVILGVVGLLLIRAHMDGQIDPETLDVPIITILAALLLSISFTAIGWLGSPPEPSSPARGWLKQALLLQVVGLLWSGFMVWAGQWSEDFAFDRTLQNAYQVAAAVEQFRFRWGRYPNSLAEVEKDTGYELPRPVYATAFYYQQENGSFTLHFSRKGRGYWQGWILDGKTGVLDTLC